MNSVSNSITILSPVFQMAKLLLLTSKVLKSIFCLLLLATTLATSARILDEVKTPVPLPADAPDTSETIGPPVADNPDVAPDVAPTTTPPSGQIPATAAIPSTHVAPIIPTEPAAPVIAPAADIPNAGVATPVTTTAATTPSGGAATTTPPITTPAATTPVTTPSGGAAATTSGGHPEILLSFFMHDILGGSHPSGRVVTGIVANSDASSLPFSKPNNQIFPINGGVPLNTINGVVNNNNFPFLVGLNGSPTNTLLQNNGNDVVSSGSNNQAFVTAGQLPQGLTLQQLMFGSVTVVDNEITEAHELGSAVLGKAQGFYIVSSTDGSSHTVALTALFHGGEHETDDTISFLGVHRTATPISHIAIVGGTGKYENAKGYAAVETLPHEDQHTTDGVETITHFTLYLTP